MRYQEDMDLYEQRANKVCQQFVATRSPSRPPEVHQASHVSKSPALGWERLFSLPIFPLLVLAVWAVAMVFGT